MNLCKKHCWIIQGNVLFQNTNFAHLEKRGVKEAE